MSLAQNNNERRLDITGNRQAYKQDMCDFLVFVLFTGNGSYGQYGASMSAYAHQAPQYACEPSWAAVRYAGLLNHFTQHFLTTLYTTCNYCRQTLQCFVNFCRSQIANTAYDSKFQRDVKRLKLDDKSLQLSGIGHLRVTRHHNNSCHILPPIQSFRPTSFQPVSPVCSQDKTNSRHRSFSSAAPQYYGAINIPTPIRVSPSLDSFKCHLKNYYFASP